MSHKNLIIFVSIGIIILIGAFLIYNNIQSKLPQSPQIYLFEEEWDFGKIKEDEKPVHIFTLKNTGREELIISRIRASCACTATMLSSDHILPGKSAELKVTFNPTGYNGLVKKDIYLESNDPQLPKTKIVVIAEVEPIPSPQAFLSNSQWDLGLISQGDTPTFTFTIENKGDLDLIIDNIDVFEYIQHNVEVPLNILPGEQKEVIFTYDSSQRELGEVRESIRIYCNDPKRKAFSLRINGYIKEKAEPSVSISPLMIEFDLTNNTEGGLVGKLSLENSGENLIKVISLKTSTDYLVPLRSEVELDSKEKKDVAVVLLKDKIKEEDTEEYLYLTIALPIVIKR